MSVKKNKNGFSLIEILTVIGILGVIMAASLISLNASKESISMKQAQATVVSSLEEAQNRAATGFGTKKHGVRVKNNKIIIFEGDTYDTRISEKIFPLSNIITDKADLDIIFDRIKATTSDDTTIALIYSNGDKKFINIFKNGKISVQ